MTPDERFDAKWMPEPTTGCYLWMNCTMHTGYGSFSFRGCSRPAHRYAWERANGPVPPGLHLDHYVCDTPQCVNPDHLRPTTMQHNLTRSGRDLGTLNAAKTQCPSGHPYDEANTYRTPSGDRKCRACHRQRARAAYRPRKAA